MFSLWFISGGQNYNLASIFVARNIVLLEHKLMLLVRKRLLYRIQQMSIDDANVRMLVEIFIKDHQIATTMDADTSSNHGRNVSTWPKS